MRIGGLQPFSLSDYPGKVAAIVFTQGCNFRCPFCHNGSLLPMQAETEIPEEQVWDLLGRRQGKLDGVVISGGEPTLQRDLVDFMQQVKSLGFLVKLDTNGSRPDVVRFILDEGLADYIAMDIKAPWERYRDLCGVQTDVNAVRRTAEMIAGNGLDHGFRTTVVPQLLSEQDIDTIRATIPSDSPYTTQKFIPQNAFDPALRDNVE